MIIAPKMSFFVKNLLQNRNAFKSEMFLNIDIRPLEQK